MIPDNVLVKTREFFPDFQIKYKDESTLMWILSKILFFNKNFMTNFTTTIGSTIYFPSKKYEDIRPISSLIILLHECIHINDAKKINKFLFSFLYLLPVSLCIILLPLLFITWYMVLPLIILSLCPIPAYFRMNFEKRAYLVSLYSNYQLSLKKNYTLNLDSFAATYVSNFKNYKYYFMWIFKDLDKDFADAVIKIKAGEKPYQDPVFSIVDKILEVC